MPPAHPHCLGPSQTASSRLVSRSQCSSPGAKGISGLHSRHTRADRHPSRVEAKNPALLSSRDGYLLELTGWTKASQASCGVWREVARLVSRPCRRRRPSSLDDGGVLGLFSSGGPSVRFLTWYDGEVSEPLVGRQGSRVSMRVARASASLFSSHGRVPGTSPG